MKRNVFTEPELRVLLLEGDDILTASPEVSNPAGDGTNAPDFD